MRNPILLSLLSAVLLACGWLGGSGITLLGAFVPLLFLSDRYGKGTCNSWKMFGCVALAFGLWGISTLWWIWYAAWIGPVSSISVMVFFFGTIFMFYHWSSKRMPRVLAFTVLVSAWISFEFAYLNGQISFPWLNLGNGFANDVRLVQWYDITGAFGGALWVWLSNISLYYALKNRRTARYWYIWVAVVLIPISVSLVKYYTYKESGTPVTITVVQPNIDPYHEKYIIPQQTQTAIMLDLASRAPADADYVIFPETSIHENIWENDIDHNPIINQFRDFARERYPHTQFIVGASSYKRYFDGDPIPSTARTNKHTGIRYDAYNTAIAIDSTDSLQLHHKYMLVVGVERMPYHNILKHFEHLIIDLGGTTGQLGFDSVRRVFTHPSGMVAAPGICYESIYGEYIGEFVRKGAQAIFIITNDGWWHDTPGYKQHFSFSRLRTIETRKSLARSANTGISGFINQRGDVLCQTAWDERTAITATILFNDKQTFYTKFGDFIARGCIFAFVFCVLYCIYMLYWNKNKRRNTDYELPPDA